MGKLMDNSKNFFCDEKEFNKIKEKYNYKKNLVKFNNDFKSNETDIFKNYENNVIKNKKNFEKKKAELIEKSHVFEIMCPEIEEDFKTSKENIDKEHSNIFTIIKVNNNKVQELEIEELTKKNSLSINSLETLYDNELLILENEKKI